jgi:uncharacterized protein (DUF433 family)
MLSAKKGVSAAEIAFIAGLTDKEVNRLVDENILPAVLFFRGEGRRFAPLTAPIAIFYFRASEDLTRAARVKVIQTLIGRLSERPDFDDFLALNEWVLRAGFDWSVASETFTVFLARFVEEASRRASQVSEASLHILEDPEVLSGAPCFAGTRVPVANVLAAYESGIPLEELQAAYPFLTERLLVDAEIYMKAHPRPGRPRRLDEANAQLRLISRKVVRRARGGE